MFVSLLLSAAEMHKTLTGDYLVADASSKTTSEVRIIPLKPSSSSSSPTPVLVAPRRDGVLYEVEHWKSPQSTASGDNASMSDWLVILTNAGGAKNFQVMAAPMASPGPEHWRPVIPHSKSVHVTGVDVFSSFWAIYGRHGGYKNIWIVQTADVAAFLTSSSQAPSLTPQDAEAPDASGRFVRLTRIPSRDDVYVIGGARGNMEYDVSKLRFTYGSPVTPSCTCEYAIDSPAASLSSGAASTGMVDGSWDSSVTVLKQKEVPNCDPAAYATTRIFATAQVRLLTVVAAIITICSNSFWLRIR